MSADEHRDNLVAKLKIAEMFAVGQEEAEQVARAILLHLRAARSSRSRCCR